MILNVLKILKLTVARNNNVLEVYKIKNIKKNIEKNKENIHYFEVYKIR